MGQCKAIRHRATSKVTGLKRARQEHHKHARTSRRPWPSLRAELLLDFVVPPQTADEMIGDLRERFALRADRYESISIARLYANRHPCSLSATRGPRSRRPRWRRPAAGRPVAGVERARQPPVERAPCAATACTPPAPAARDGGRQPPNWPPGIRPRDHARVRRSRWPRRAAYAGIASVSISSPIHVAHPPVGGRGDGRATAGAVRAAGQSRRKIASECGARAGPRREAGGRRAIIVPIWRNLNPFGSSASSIQRFPAHGMTERPDLSFTISPSSCRKSRQ